MMKLLYGVSLLVKVPAGNDTSMYTILSYQYLRTTVGAAYCGTDAKTYLRRASA